MTGTQQQNWWLQCLLLFFQPAWEAPVTSQVCLFVSFVCLLHLCVCLANMRGTSDKSGDTELTQFCTVVQMLHKMKNLSQVLI